MPQFTPEQSKQILAVVNEKWRNSKCEICQTEDATWNLIGQFIAAPLLPLGTAAVPMIGFICQTCGHTRFMSAMQIGVYPVKSVAGLKQANLEEQFDPLRSSSG